MLLRFKELGYEYSKDLENDEFVQRLAYFSDFLKLLITQICHLKDEMEQS